MVSRSFIGSAHRRTLEAHPFYDLFTLLQKPYKRLLFLSLPFTLTLSRVCGGEGFAVSSAEREE